MICLSCRRVGPPMCTACVGSVRPVPPGVTPGGLVVQSWATHEGAASTLVRRLKYEGVVEVARLLGPRLAALVPEGTNRLVPVPRCVVRRIEYGVDAASEIAVAVSAVAGIPVDHLLVPQIWSKSNAGAARSQRRAPVFRARSQAPGILLVDDVATTGATLDAATSALSGVVGALTATRVH